MLPMLKLQVVSARDQFDCCTLTVEQWLASSEGYGGEWWKTRTDKWMSLLQACALVAKTIEQLGLRQEPRIGYDLVNDQPVFIFKGAHAGTTCVVSFQGVEGLSDIEENA